MLCLVCIATFHIAPTLLQMKTFGALAERSDTIAYEVENRLTNMLRSMKIGDIGKDEAAFSQVRMFCEAILNPPKVDVEHLRDIMESCEMVRDLLQSSDMTRLETAVNTLQSSAQECQDDPKSVQTKLLSAFFLKHKVGAGLLAWARQLLDCNENAVEFDKGLESMRENSQALAHKGVSPETLNNELNRFWKACTPVQSMDALPHQKLQLEASMEELWVSVTGMVTHVLKNALTGTLEIVFEAVDNGGKVAADDKTEEECKTFWTSWNTKMWLGMCAGKNFSYQPNCPKASLCTRAWPGMLVTCCSLSCQPFRVAEAFSQGNCQRAPLLR